MILKIQTLRVNTTKSNDFTSKAIIFWTEQNRIEKLTSTQNQSPQILTVDGGGSTGGDDGFRRRSENKRFHIGEDIIEIIIIEIDRWIIFETLKISFELIVKIKETLLRDFLRSFNVFLQIRPDKLAGYTARPRRRNEIGDYSSSTHGGSHKALIFEGVKCSEMES